MGLLLVGSAAARHSFCVAFSTVIFPVPGSLIADAEPVHTPDWSTQLANVGQFFYLLAIFIVVVALAYLTTRLIANAKFKRGTKRNLEVMESIGIGQQAFVHIVRAGEKYMLLGVTRGQINALAELDKAGLDIPQVRSTPSFQSIFDRFKRAETQEPDDGSENDP